MNQTPIVFLAFANDEDSYLKNLIREGKAIRDNLWNAADEGYIDLYKDENMSISDLYKAVARYQKRIVIFHYGGHANGQALMFEGEIDMETADAAGLANTFKVMPNLQLVFLNGCATYGQVDQLLERGVKAVIATSVGINDAKAQEFSEQFYQALANDKTIGESFGIASQFIQTKYKKELTICTQNGLKLKRKLKEDFPWGLYCQDEMKMELDWRLPSKSYKRHKLIGLFIVIALGVFASLYPFLDNSTLTSNERSQIIPFDEDSTFKILLLNFDRLERCEKDEIYCLKSIKKRFSKIGNDYNVGLTIRTDLNYNVYSSISYDSAKIIGEAYNADLIIWGDYEKQCKWDSTLLNVKYLSLGEYGQHLFKGKKGNDFIVSHSFMKDIIQKGTLTSNIEDIIFWSLGMKYIESDMEKSITFFKRIQLHIQEEYKYIYHVLGTYHHNKDNLDSTLYYFNNLIEIDSNYAMAYYGKGTVMCQKEELELGLDYFDKAIELKHIDSGIYYNRGYANFKLNRYEEALIDLSRSIKLSPNNNNDIYSLRGTTYLMLKQYKNALIDINKSISLFGDNLLDREHRLYANLKLNKKENLLNDYTAIIKLKPEKPETYQERGDLYFDLKKYKEAIKDYNKCIDFNYNLAYNYNILGFSYQKINADNKAIETFSLGLKSPKPNENEYQAYLLNNRAFSYLKINELTLAKKDAKKSLELNKSNSYVYFTFACIYASENNDDLFYKYLKQAIERKFPIKERLNEEYLKPYLKQKRFEDILQKPNDK